MNTLPFNLGFVLPDFQISHEDQLILIRTVRTLQMRGLIKARGHTTQAYTGPDFIYPLAFRKCVKNGVTQVANLPNRYNLELDWVWDETVAKEAMDAMRRIMAPFEPLYKHLTRCVVLLNVFGVDLPLHVDSYEYHKDIQEAQQNLAIKLPLTSIKGNNGIPIVELDGITYQYDAGDCAFMINEVDITHGARGVEHQTRGVIFLDGILDMNEIEKLRKAPLPIRKEY